MDVFSVGRLRQRVRRIIAAGEDGDGLDAVLPEGDGINDPLGDPYLVARLQGDIRRTPPQACVRAAEILLAHFAAAV